VDNRQTTTTATASNDATTSRGRGCGCWIALIVVLLLGGGAATFFGATFALQQNRVLEPEALGADAAKRLLMIPGSYKDWRMPDSIRNDPQAATRGGTLFSAECALCHGQNGKGPKPGQDWGAAMFPPAVPLNRERTQSKSEGEIFYLIWHGINYTGMPAWGKDNDPGGTRNGPHTQAEVWDLVAYVKSLK
jgi:mono/diheme cytochrome c family protein